MRTAARIALMLTGTAIFVAAIAASGVQAGRASLEDIGVEAPIATSMPQRAQPMPRLDRIDYVLATEVASIETAIAHQPQAPGLAHATPADRDRVATAVMVSKTTNRSIEWSACGGRTFAAQQINASDGGREGQLGSTAEAFGSLTPCLAENPRSHRMRDAIFDNTEQLQVEGARPSPVIIKFEAVIHINLAALDW
jgi:hypothetical protein